MSILIDNSQLLHGFFSGITIILGLNYFAGFGYKDVWPLGILFFGFISFMMFYISQTEGDYNDH